MDGIDRLIEMLEKRFNKFWANALLLFAVLGAAAWGIHTFAVDFLIPASTVAVSLYGYVRGFHASLPSEYEPTILLIAGKFQAVIPLGLLAYLLVYLRRTRRVLIADADTIQKDFAALRKLSDDAYAHEMLLIQKISELQTENESLKARIPQT